MGACVSIAGKPPPVNIKMPGGSTISSMAGATQGVPNDMDPFQSLIEGVQPALSSVKPVFDVIGFVMAAMDLLLLYNKVVGFILGTFVPGNPFTSMFTLDPLLDENDEPVLLIPPIEIGGVSIFEGGPEIPDVGAVAPDLIDGVLKVICFAIKLAGLIPQLSSAFTIKDSLLTAIQFGDAAMGQVNSLVDLFAGIPAANTGLGPVDDLLQCASDNSSTQTEHKLGPLSNLVPLMSIVSLIADIAAQPLPGVVFDMAKLIADPAPAGFGIIPFPDLSGAPINGPTPDEQREQFLQLIEDMTITGLPIEIPDFSDLSSIGTIIEEIKAQLEPLNPVIELLQSVLDKLTKC